MADRAEVKFVDGWIGFWRRLADVHEQKKNELRGPTLDSVFLPGVSGEVIHNDFFQVVSWRMISNSSKHFRSRKRKRRTSENRPWYSAGAQRGVTDMAEVKFVDLLVGVQSPHVTIQGKQRTN